MATTSVISQPACANGNGHDYRHTPRIYLEKTQNSRQLVVNGKPILMLAAELQNSSLTSAEYMNTVWQNLVDMNVNTVLGCVTWEMIEAVEGEFHFTELDQVIKDARAYGLHLVLLWFGSFKNGLSTYTPAWVKKNHKRFPRAKLRKAGGTLETADVVSIFHPEAREADATAFGMLMRHLKEVDEAYSTVIMVQVENETGLLGDSRDGSPAANKIFSQPVPAELIDYLTANWETLHQDLKVNLKSFESRKGLVSWDQVFGKSQQTDELFMAYHHARYLDHVAAVGKMEYNIPFYTNVWQNYFGHDGDNASPVVAAGGGDPGDYPSGGGVSGVLDIWMEFARNLDFIAPDVYLNDYASSCAKYRHRDQPLFIPEQRRDEYGARRIWKAFGSYQALGTSPFGIDTLTPETSPFTRHYSLLQRVQHIVLDAQRRPRSSVGFFFDEMPTDGGQDPSPPTIAQFGAFQVRIERSFVFGTPGPGAGMCIHLGGGKFLLIGWGFQAVFRALSSKATFTGILRMEEKIVTDVEKGTLKTCRLLNGDETRSGKFCIMPNEEPDYGGFPICVTIPARTMIAEVEVYALEEDEESTTMV